MTRAAALVALALVWVAFGVYGALSYGNAYLTYRGFPPPKDPTGVAPGRLVREKVYSRALGQTRGYLVYEPPGYAAAVARGQRLPVLYLLHGAPGWPRQFIDVADAGVDLDTAIATHALRPFLLVMPDGHDGTFRSETEWADTPHGRYESWFLEVVHAVDRRFPTVRDRRYRAVGGNSEGGYAAVNIALRHPKLFSIAESWSGYAIEHQKGAFAKASRAQILANSPTYYVPFLQTQLQRYPLHAYIYSGRRDKGLPKRVAFSHELAAAGGHVTFSAFRGGHDWAVWRAQTPLMLSYAGHLFGRGR
jgi:enterochelin esterase-like enzyme